MVRNVILDSIFALEGSWSEVSNLPGDRGGYTQGGISSRSFPGLADMIKRGSLSHSQIRAIYYEHYYSKISGYLWLEINLPEILSLLYQGKVHGSGIRQYTLVIQRFLNDRLQLDLNVDGLWGPLTLAGVKSASHEYRELLWLELNFHTSDLARERVASVGVAALNKGIENRVWKEFDAATVLRSVKPAMLVDVISEQPSLGTKPERDIGFRRALESISLRQGELTLYV